MRKTVLKHRHRIALVRPIGLMGLAWLVLVSVPVRAQWRQIFARDYYHSGPCTCIYFIDLPGLPRIGFAYMGYDVIKTTDGGYSWNTVDTMTSLYNFAFKDSLNGWYDGGNGLHRTTDAGSTWTLESRLFGGNDFYYDKKYDGMFVSGPLYNIELSWDEGKTWTSFIPGADYVPQAFSFWNDDTGVVNWDYGSGSFYRTTDGGRTWNPAPANAGGGFNQVLAIPGTSTAFALDNYGVVRRTDDLWNTAKAIYQFPSEETRIINPGGAGGSTSIFGNLQNMYVMLDSGCFRSTDQGVTWKYLCGVGPTAYIVPSKYYAKDNLVYISTYDRYGGRLWMLNLDSMQYFPTSVQFVSGVKDSTVIPGSSVAVNFVPETTAPISLDSGTVTFQFDTNALDLRQIILPPNWQLIDSSESNGILRIHFLASDSLPNPIAQLIFSTYLSPETSSATKVYLDSASLFGHRLNCDCQALSILQPDSISHSAPDSVQINFLMACGDSTLLAAMEHQPPFSIESVVPNPAGASVRVSGSGCRVSGLEVQLFDALGNCVITEHDPIPYTLTPTPYTLPLDVSGLPSGIYFLRISSGGYAVSRSVAIQR